MSKTKTKIILPPSARLKIPPLPPSALARSSSSPAIPSKSPATSSSSAASGFLPSASSSSTSLSSIDTSSTTSLVSQTSNDATPTGSNTPTPRVASPARSVTGVVASPARKPNEQPRYQLTRRNIPNYDSLASQLHDAAVAPLTSAPVVITTSDGEERTKIRMDLNLSVDVELSPSIHGDLQLSMLCIAIKQDPSKSKTVSGGKRLVGTIMRVSDDKEMVYRQVVGLSSWREWWWVCRSQAGGIIRRKSREAWEDMKEKAGSRERAMVIYGGAGLLFALLVCSIMWWSLGFMKRGLCRMICPVGS